MKSNDPASNATAAHDTAPDGAADPARSVTIVAIDGPAGAGKSTIASLVADRLGVPILDTGAMYRAVTWAALDRGVDPDDVGALGLVVEDMELVLADGGVFVDGKDVTKAIRSEPVTDAVSAVSAAAVVRTTLRLRQRDWAFSSGGGVMEGRDIGSVVFPDATLKVYLTASLEERARRRAAETGAPLDEVMADVAARDHADSTREIAPLQKAADAVEVDSTNRTVEDVVAEIVELAIEASAAVRGSEGAAT